MMTACQIYLTDNRCFCASTFHIEHNLDRLCKESSKTNPVALIKAKTTRGSGASKHTFGEVAPPACMLCRGAWVALDVCNLKPKWGLHRNAHGVVIDIIYDPGKSPNDGDLPRYIIVEVPKYCGPVWYPDHPKWIPVPCLTKRCDEKGCCERLLVPLKLSYGATIHSFQGGNVGKTKEGQPANDFEHIIADPGTPSFEGKNPGLFYSLLGRATTLGESTDRLKSAIFFQGENMNPSRVLNLTSDAKGNQFKRVMKRAKWMKRIERNTVQCDMTTAEKNNILQWASTHKCEPETLQRQIDNYGWRQNNDLNY